MSSSIKPQKIRNTDLFELPHEQQGQVLTVKQQHEQCINRQQYLKALGTEVDESKGFQGLTRVF